MRIAIVGGGISGLATAFYLQRLRPEVELVLLEAGPHLGGTMHTENVGGFLFETGSNGFLSNKPDTLQLVRDCGADGLLLPSNDAARVRYIYSDRLHRLPESPPAFVRSGLLSWRGKLRVLGELVVPARRDAGDESLQAFGYRRLGREFTDTFLDAMSAGIYAATPATLSVAAAFPAVVRLEREFGGLFKGMLRLRRREAGPGGKLMSFTGGVGRFVDHLSGVLRAEIEVGTPVQALERRGSAWRLLGEGVAVAADHVVLATPAYAAAELLAPLAPALAARLQDIRYSPIAVVGFGYRALPEPLYGFGLLTTAASRQPILGVLWDSAIFPDRAPAGMASLRVMIGGQRDPALALQGDAELAQLALAGIKATMGLERAPEVTFVKRWERGIPDYRVGHLANVEAIMGALQALPGLHLNVNAYRGVSLNDCVGNSRRLAEALLGRGSAGA
jgi:oxygen-dependent protoporphyrinogen oxidase